MTRLFVVLLTPALLLAGCASRPEMTSQEARVFTRRALAAAGVHGVSVGPRVTARECGRPPVAGWWATAHVAAGGSVAVCVERKGDEVAYVRDEGPKGGPLFDDTQVRRLDAFTYDPVAARWSDRRLPASAAIALVVAAIAALALIRRRLS